jgi:hypothetical protein
MILLKPCAVSASLMGFFSPTATWMRRSTNPGFQARFVPPSGFLTLLTVYSLQRLPTTRIGAIHGVHPTERFPLAEPYAFRRHDPHAVSDIACSCSEDQEVTMPRNSRALLPAKIRTRLKPMRARADTLMGFCTLRQQILSQRAPVARHPP